MRPVLVLALICLTSCASEKLAQAPPAGVDFSGHWKLNEADSDDPQRLIQTQFDAPAARQGASPSGGPGGGAGRRGGQGGGPGSSAGLGGPGEAVMPSVGAMGEGLRWPGKLLEIKQVAGVVAFSSGGVNRVCQPMDEGRAHGNHGAPPSRDGASPGRGLPSGGRDALPRGRDTPPPHCGWTNKTLVVRGGDLDDDRPPFVEQYSLSEDGQRLVEVVGFGGGRLGGFSMSRVWDRAK